MSSTPSLTDRLTAIFARIDKNGDKKLTKEECLSYWNSSSNAEDMVNMLDTDEDGFVTISEWLAFFKAFKAAKPDEFEVALAHIEKAEA